MDGAPHTSRKRRNAVAYQPAVRMDSDAVRTAMAQFARIEESTT
jgi:hypothetical protein